MTEDVHYGVLSQVSKALAAWASKPTSEVLEQLDFSQRSLGENLFAEDIGDLLDGHTFTSLHIGSGTIQAN